MTPDSLKEELSAAMEESRAAVLTPPPTSRQQAMFNLGDLDILMPGPSWADLAENDYEMQLMGPPPTLPPGIDKGWIHPLNTTRNRSAFVPITPFLSDDNRFAMLHRIADDEPNLSDPDPWPEPEPMQAEPSPPVHAAPSSSSPGSGHHSGPSTESSPSASVAPHAPPPSPRTD